MTTINHDSFTLKPSASGPLDDQIAWANHEINCLSQEVNDKQIAITYDTWWLI